MMLTTSPLPWPSIFATPESWLIASCSFSPLPFIAAAALSTKRLNDVAEAPLIGPRSLAKRINWSLTWSHSTGTAVRSTPICAPSVIVGPESS